MTPPMVLPSPRKDASVLPWISSFLDHVSSFHDTWLALRVVAPSRDGARSLRAACATVRRLFDPNAPSSRLALAELAKEGVAKHLHRYAVWRTGDEDAAEDLVANTLVLVCDPNGKRTWDPAKRTFKRHMRLVMDRVAIAQGRRGAGRFEINETALIARTGDPEAFPDPPEERPGPDDAVHRQRRLALWRRLAEVLLRRLRGRDDFAVEVFHVACAVEEPAEQASYLGVPVEEVYEAHRRLRYHGQQVRYDWEQAEAARMTELRSVSERQKKKEDPSS